MRRGTEIEQVNRDEEINKWGIHRERQMWGGRSKDSIAGVLRMRRDGRRERDLSRLPSSFQRTAATRLEREGM